QTQDIIHRSHCDCELAIHEQLSWTKKTPRRRFRACPIYDEDEKCGVYKFLDPKLPSQYYKDLLYKMHLENVKCKKLIEL
nr:hypothetical protein [Tanacetum cinerariifolium]